MCAAKPWPENNEKVSQNSQIWKGQNWKGHLKPFPHLQFSRHTSTHKLFPPSTWKPTGGENS